jgi:sugar phosphate isomerase/epimerase
MAAHLLSMNEVSTYRWSFDKDVYRYVQAGYEAIGVWRQKLADYGEERGVDLLAESGLHVTNLHWAGGFTGSDGLSLQESIDDAAHAIRLAGATRAGCLVVYPGGRNNHTFRHAERLLRTAIDSMLDLAEAADVTLAIKPMHPACAVDWTFLTDIESTIALLDHYQSPRLRMVLDVYHFGHCNSMLANLAQVVPHTALVQLGDRRSQLGIDHNRCPLGTGKIPLAQIVRHLVEAGYQGDFDIELVGQDMQLCDYEHLLKASKRAFDQMLSPVPEC